jgi:hypothetical protein
MVKHVYKLPKTAKQMKTMRLLLILSTLLLSLSVDANRDKKTISSPKPDTTLCLEIEGKVLNSDQDGTASKVEVFLGDKLVDSVILKGKHRKFSFQFKKNQHYTIRISKAGFMSKSICVHTNMQEAVEELLYEFYFETTLVYAKPDAVELPPVATIYFNPNRNCFYYTRTNPYVPGKANCMKTG